MDESPIRLTACKIRQKVGEFFLASIPAKDLVRISYSDVRRLAEDQRDFEKYLGIQRPVSTKRVQEIRKYLEGRDATFPTAVILAVDERCATFDGKSGELFLSPYTPEVDTEEEAIPVSKIARVIDGQHRIAAFLDEDNEWLFKDSQNFSDFEFNLAIFVGADIPEQANIFATVNLAQTKVNKSLVYDLTGLAKSRSPHKTCHNVAIMLDREQSSPLYKRIKRLGVATPGREKEPLTQAAFVESLIRFISPDPVRDRNEFLDGKKPLVASTDILEKYPFRNMFLENREAEIGLILFNYFNAVRKKWPASWDSLDLSSNLLPRSNAFKALMKFLREDVYLKIVGTNFGRIPSEEDFYLYFSDLEIRDDDFTTKNFVPGSGGQSAFLRMLRGQLTRNQMIQ